MTSGSVVSMIRGDRAVYTSGDSILTMSLDGGVPTVVARGITEPNSATWSPDGTQVVSVRGNVGFLDMGNISPSSIWVVAASGGSRTPD